ncbi:MAG: serine hydrolase [Clostridia bacterium]|nr:serine hydrolase [Clostridia bacterium]
MFEKITPEAAGISSLTVKKFIEKLEKRGAIMHSVLLFRHGKIFAEHYWAPYNENSLNRMYSQTKSYVAMAIGLLEEEGKLSLDDKIADFFPEKIDGEISEHLKSLTIRNMLTMTTAGECRWWFTAGDPDRTHHYFNGRDRARSQGTYWEYDSAGSQVMSALVEKLSGMKLLDYLKLKVFNKIGSFKNARILMCPNGDSWGDSALLCTSRDMATGGQLLLNGGRWGGEQLLPREYVKDATSALVSNKISWQWSPFYGAGYGYQIWQAPEGGFAFVGMGDQITLCLPDKDFMFVCTADHQAPASLGDKHMRATLINALYDVIVDNLSDAPLPECEADYNEYIKATKDLKLRASVGVDGSALRDKISGVEYICQKNPMGISRFKFEFSDGEGKFHYTNAQGDKVIPFGINKNVFGKFPELGYASEYGEVKTTDGFMYDDAVSLAFLDESRLILDVKIIDKYLGTMSAIFGFNGNEAAASFTKAAEHFLEEYDGILTARAKD